MKANLLSCLIWNTELFCRQWSGIGPHHDEGGSLIVLLVLRRESGVYS